MTYVPPLLKIVQDAFSANPEDLRRYRSDLEHIAHVLRDTLDQELRDLAERINAEEADPHEQAAARARGNDFADTGGKDWT